MPTRLRKVRRLRGSRTHGYGQVGQHRHSGKQGGHGQAGLHKHKWSWTVKYDPNHFGRDDFVPPGYPKPKRWVNVGDLGQIATGGKPPREVDLTSMGIQKLLGSGEVAGAFNVKVKTFTKRAQTKLEEAGGKILG